LRRSGRVELSLPESGAEAVRLSVAVVTRNRPDSLDRALSSLRAQSLQPWEVVVSDDSDGVLADETRAVAERHECTYTRGPHRGLYANRNHAALACTGTHIRTMDDDHELPAGHLERCLAAIAAEPETIWVIGEHLAGREAAGPPPAPGELDPRGFTVEPRDPQSSRAIADGSTIYPRVVFDRGVRFVEAFPFGPTYLELGARLRWLGYRNRWLDSTYVVHHFDPHARSFDDDESILAARVFAMLCLVNLYEPSLGGKLSCTAALAAHLLRRPRVALGAIPRGVAAYRARRREALPA
jgi:glycosyltransferase involved in cell wall biosynthesis